jgi:hypothetical protein
MGAAKRLSDVHANHRPLERPGDNPVDSPVTCVITRFGLRSSRQLLPTYRDYKRVVREAAQTQTPGLLRTAFLIENSVTCYSLSIWATPEAIPHFGTNVRSHVHAGNRIFGRLSWVRGRPEIWSTKWSLASVSNNLTWDEFDLRDLILGMDDGTRNGEDA